MRKYFLLVMALCPILLIAQDQTNDKQKKPASAIGLKGGLNFANVTKASSINGTNRTGFNIGAFRTMGLQKVIGFRMALDFSRQGYNYKTNTNTGSVDMDYIIYSNGTAINIGKFAQIYLGAQLAYLLNAKADSTSDSAPTSPGSPQVQSMNSTMKYFNRIDHGASAGFEIYPYKGILIGAKYTLSFGDPFKVNDNASAPAPSFLPSFNAKNNVVQLYIGYKFSKKS